MAKKREVERNFEVHTNPHPEPLVRDVPDVLREMTPAELREQKRQDLRFVAHLKWRGKRVWKNRSFVFMPEDEQAFTDLLKKTFPRIRFLDKSALGTQKLEAFGNTESFAEPELRYFDSLADPSEHFFLCWVEPKGWRPKIGPTRWAPKVRCILNQPRLQFGFRALRVVWPEAYKAGHYFRRKNKPLPPSWDRRSGWMQAHPLVDDAKHKAFLGKAYNLVTKVATNKLIPVDPVTGRSPETPKPRGENLWVGHHALAWCRENPRHFLDGRYRPADEAEWRSKIPEEHSDFQTDDEAHERFVARVRFEQQAREERQQKLAEAKAAGAQGNPKKKTSSKRTTSGWKPPKKKGG